MFVLNIDDRYIYPESTPPFHPPVCKISRGIRSCLTRIPSTRWFPGRGQLSNPPIGCWLVSCMSTRLNVLCWLHRLAGKLDFTGNPSPKSNGKHALRKAFKGCCAHHLWRLCEWEELQGAEWGNVISYKWECSIQNFKEMWLVIHVDSIVDRKICQQAV